MQINNKTKQTIKYLVTSSTPGGKVLMEGELKPGSGRSEQLDESLAPYSVYAGLTCEPSMHYVADTGRSVRNSSTMNIFKIDVTFGASVVNTSDATGAEEQAPQPG